MAASGRSNAVQPYSARLPAVRGVTIYGQLQLVSNEEACRFRVLHQTREQTRTIYFAIIVTIFLVRGSMIRTWPCSSA
jgi:hypothetical protein